MSKPKAKKSPKVPGEKIEYVPLQAACPVTAHVVKGKVVKVSVSVEEIELSEDLPFCNPKPSKATILAVQTAIENGELPEVTLG